MSTLPLRLPPRARDTPGSAPGDIDWHITLRGDAVVIATDDSGNSVRVTCSVPPPPK